MQVMGGSGKFAKALAMSVLGMMCLEGCGSSKTTVGQVPAAKQEGGQTSGNQGNTSVDTSRVLVANSFYLEVLSGPSAGSSRDNSRDARDNQRDSRDSLRDPRVGSRENQEESLPLRTRSSIGPIAGYSTLRDNELSAGSTVTGAVTSDRFAYTSLVSDVLLATLRDQEFKTSEPRRSLNFQAAAKVLSAKMQTDLATNSVEVVVQYLISNYVSEMKYVGIYNPFGETLLHPVADWAMRSWSGSDSRYSPELAASFKCLSTEGSCQTAVFAVDSARTGSVKIILRKSVADLKAILVTQNQATASSQSLISVLMNTFIDAQRVKQKSDVVPALGQFDNKLVSSTLQSFEVINGRSGFTASLVTEKGDTLALSGPLVNSLSSSVLRVAADISLRTERTCNTRNSSGYCNSSMSDVSEATLVGNDTLGNISLDLSLSRVRGTNNDRFGSRATLIFSKQK